MRLRVKDVDKFMKGVAPFMKESFSYKLIWTESPTVVGDDIVCAPQGCGEVDGNNPLC